MIVFDLCGLALVSAYLRKEGITDCGHCQIALFRKPFHQSVHLEILGRMIGKLVVYVLGQV